MSLIQQRVAKHLATAALGAALLLLAPLQLFGASDEHAAAQSGEKPLAFLHADGLFMARPDGTHLVLKGCNLGNWLMLEPWMFGGIIEARDQARIFSTLQSRFGIEKAEHLVHLYREGYVTPRDFDLIKSFGFNVVRVPFDYRLLQSDEAPYPLKPNRFEWLDNAVDMAEKAGVYVILDLHGAPGGQSNQMHTGEAGQNKLWDSQEAQDRTVQVYRAIAEHFRDRSAVAAYDLLNEPYGDYHTDLRPRLVTLMGRLYASVREVDPRHVIFLPGPLQKGVEFYGNPHDRGWHDVGFTEHYYPGLFGDNPVVESHARTLNRTFPQTFSSLQKVQVPYYIGEFNVVRDSVGGARMMREYFDRMGGYGWTATMWSYKLLSAHGGVHGDSWCMVSNSAPLPALSLERSSYGEFEAFTQSLAQMPLAVNEPLRAALTMSAPAKLPLNRYDSTTEAGGNTKTPVNLLAAIPLSAWSMPTGITAKGDSELVLDVALLGGGQKSTTSPDVSVRPGQRYEFSILASSDSAVDFEGRFDIRMENGSESHPLVLNSTTILGAELAKQPAPTRVTLDATPIYPDVRIVISTHPEHGVPIKGAVTLSRFSLQAIGSATP